jgi:ABC-type branched-subunit amino acid transport system substrate-binding protein
MERKARPFTLSLFLCVWLSVFCSACSASTAPVIKIGLVAPFEGRYRSIGYEAIYAARLAIREINAKGGINGYRIELVALDDRGDHDRAIESARKLAIDPQVVAVIGHYRPDSTDAAIETYCTQHVPLVAIESASPLPDVCRVPLNVFVLGHASVERWPADRLTFVSNVPNPTELPAAQNFVAAYNAIPIDGTRAGPIALQTYDAMYLLFDALSRAGKIDRTGVAAAVAISNFSRLGRRYAFDPQGNLIDAKVYVYQYGYDGQPQLITLP